jgi:DNA-binding transcriptional LysR family regulator
LEANDLLLFACVVEAGSFSRAAQRLRQPKSTVSRRVSALERQLGERLLHRTTRRLTLTDFGQSVLLHARALADEVDATLALALHRQSQPSGRLRVTMPSDLAEGLLTQMLSRFIERHQAVTLELDLTPRRVDLIGEGFDLALRMGELPDDATLVGRRLCTMTTGLYASPHYLALHGEPQVPEDLRRAHGLLLLGREGNPIPWTLQRGSPPHIERWHGMPVARAVINSPTPLLRLAGAGLGIVAAAEWAAAPQVARGEIKRVLPAWCLPPEPAWAVMPSRRLMPAKTRAFLAELEQALPEAGLRC